MDGVTTATRSRFVALPAEAPLDMPRQRLAQRPDAPRRRLGTAGLVARRCLVFGGVFGMTGFAAWQMYQVLAVGALTALEAVLLAIFVMLFAWIALACMSAIGGFLSLLSGGGRALGILDGETPRAIPVRTALLLPTYNEEPARIVSAIQAMHESLCELGAGAAFDFFILSDTTDPQTWIAEEAALLTLRDRLPNGPGIFYRHRARNTARKSGNIADWVERFGAAYPQMLVLDADSIMTGDAIARLAAALARNPDVALIQTVPMIVNGSTLFARLQQFAGAVYGPLIAHGVAWWHGPDGNYWGHNAVIRTAAFAAHAGLPELRGRKPFGGHILSHDFVEAALLRRSGWAVWMVPALIGSYEESPPNVTDMAIRDRRWCQGNLQHLAVLPARGLHWVSRMHMLVGVGSYVTAPLWLLFLLVGILISLQARFIRPEYFPAGGSLFPHWPIIDPIRSIWVFVGTMGVLLLPKLLGYVAMLFDGRRRRGCGGAVRALLSVLIETLLTGLVAPIMMLTQSSAVIGILAGRDGGWQTQRRDDGGIPFRETTRLYGKHALLGLLLGGIAFAVSPFLALWMLPVVAGLLLAVPLVAFTGARMPGMALRRLGLLATPEERSPPSELVRANALRKAYGGDDDGGLRRLFADPELLAAHRRMLPSPRRRGQDPIDPALVLGLARLADADTLEAATGSLDRRELAAVLANADGLDRLAALASDSGASSSVTPLSH